MGDEYVSSSVFIINICLLGQKVLLLEKLKILKLIHFYQTRVTDIAQRVGQLIIEESVICHESWYFHIISVDLFFQQWTFISFDEYADHEALGSIPRSGQQYLLLVSFTSVTILLEILNTSLEFGN